MVVARSCAGGSLVSVWVLDIWIGSDHGQRQLVASPPGFPLHPRCDTVRPAASLPREPPIPAHQQERREQGQIR